MGNPLRRRALALALLPVPPASVTNFILLIVCFVIGLGLQRVRTLPEEMPAALNAFVIWVCLPALVLLHVPRLEWTPELLIPAAMPWVLAAVALPLFHVLGTRAGWSRGTIGALVLTAGLGNTSFVGLPMIEALIGPEALGAGLIVDQFGSFFALSFIGLSAAAVYSGEGGVSVKRILRRILLFPPFVALVLALVLRGTPELPGTALAILERLGDALAPLALVSVGMQLRLGALRGRVAPLAAGLSYKLVLAPAAVLGLLLWLAPGMNRMLLEVTVLEAAMAPMITGGIVAAQHRLNPPLAALMVGVGIPLSFVTAPLLHALVPG